MATAEQRVTAIADAVVNGPATTDQKNRMGAALAWRAGRRAEYESANMAGKATMAAQLARALIVGIVREAEAGAAAEPAGNAAAAAFPEAP